ncbi:MAG: 1,6-anhydro-N-acetylmuramyl-L-alanine amidase AmpD [Pseudomonadota bacterium]
MSAGWLPEARRIPSPNFDARPAGVEVSLVVLHCISLPRGAYGGGAIEKLFGNRLDPAEHPSFADLAGLRVSSHFLIHRDGELVQFVPLEARAWHAGASLWRARARCNDFSIGVELEGTDDSAFTDQQYLRLVELGRSLLEKLPIREFAAHSDVAPGRKSDPGPRFDWARLLAALASHI